MSMQFQLQFQEGLKVDILARFYYPSMDFFKRCMFNKTQQISCAMR